MVDPCLALPQEWAQRRFANLHPDHCMALHVVSVAGLAAPSGWEPVWTPLDGRPFACVWPGRIPSVPAILVLLNPHDQKELLRACQVPQELEDAFPDAQDALPPLFWVCHTVAPEVRPRGIGGTAAALTVVQLTMELGIEHVLTTESEGFRLALDVRTMVEKSRHTHETFELLVDMRRRMLRRKRRLESRIHSATWEYLAAKLGEGSIPRIDRTIPTGVPQQLHGWTVAEQIHHGFSGYTYLLTRPHTADRVLLALPKSEVKSVTELKCLRRCIEIMRRLSSDDWRHPGIVRLWEVFHSRSHIHICMEHAGSLTLLHRLRMRDRSEDEHCGLSVEKVRAIIIQSVAAVAHIHMGPEICHRDIKPESFLIDKTEDEPGLRLKLTDFHMANPMTQPCWTICGSLPFMAPEVALEREYAGGPADIWSLSVLTLEVLCGPRVLESALGLEVFEGGDGDPEAVAEVVVRHFEGAGRATALLRERCRPELTPLLQKVSPVLQETMQVEASRRWRAGQLQEALGELSASDLALGPGS